MEELQKLLRAREYLQQLSQGIDPISHEALPQENGLTGQRLRNCFAYVAGVLSQVIENGGQIGRQAREKKAPFSISAQQLSQVQLSDTPVSLSVVVQRINEAAGVDDTKKKLTHPPLANWLLAKGFLQEVPTRRAIKARPPRCRQEKSGLSALSGRIPMERATGSISTPGKPSSFCLTIWSRFCRNRQRTERPRSDCCHSVRVSKENLHNLACCRWYPSYR